MMRGDFNGFGPGPSPRDAWQRPVGLLYPALLTCASILSFLVYSLFGLPSLLNVTISLMLVMLFSFVSFRYIMVPVVVWLLSNLGLREALFIETPGLPDITVDRIAFMWLAGVFAMKMIVERRGLRGPFGVDALIVAHLIFVLLSCLFTNPPAVNLWSKSVLMAYAAYFLGKNLAANVRWLRVIFAIMVLLNLYYSVTSIAEKFHWDFLVWPKFILDRSIGMQVAGRSRGIFLQSAVVGTVMGMLLCTQVYFWRTLRSQFGRALMLVTIVLTFLGIFFTYTRGCWLVGIVSFLTMGIMGWRTYGRRILVVILVGALLMGAGVVNPSRDTFFEKRLKQENTALSRINAMATAFRAFRDNPITGVGFFRYNEVKFDYMATTKVPFFGVIRRGEDIASSLHDIYIGTLAEQGMVGAGLQFAIYFLIFRTMLRKFRYRRRGDHFAEFMIPAVGGLLVGYLVGGAVINYGYFSTLGVLFYFFGGAVAGHRPEDIPIRDAFAEPVRPRYLPGI